MKNFESKLAKLKKLEDRARNLQSHLDGVNYDWQNMKDSLADCPEWQAYCKEKNIFPGYSFRDVLC